MSQQPTAPDEALTTIELAAADYLTVPLPDGRLVFGVARVGLDVADLVAEHGAVVAVRQVGGLEVTWQTIARVAVELYASSYGDLTAAQQAVSARAMSRRRPEPGPPGSVRLDTWRNESAHTEQPYPGGQLRVSTSTWRVSTRSLP